MFHFRVLRIGTGKTKLSNTLFAVPLQQPLGTIVTEMGLKYCLTKGRAASKLANLEVLCVSKCTMLT